ncbi:transporter associated domain-containing protein [Limnoraphis robusta]|uniref:Transporter associated domain-containing protein n=1 Tax=Limnoraphis robusta CCNP1315 TaxID=3110306 RepID=A0ABU5TTF6_9CYAN|nr:transporter associated domain-containing protein [Limnoraphis robusta]MEA5499301.1 transporter associated domain-containing protein [Limnoraphis robusta BA-68 BA1]MEA5517977.1 transporter associated domain-containing protein [Limnoraphis robusta CCNP1315]MEA5545549.1 transporter associated domain-containing protein [Limnoraphis robusta CCNP1324]
MITHLSRIPSVADHFEWNGLRIEVVDMDGNRVDKVLVMPISRNPIPRQLD